MGIWEWVSLSGNGCLGMGIWEWMSGNGYLGMDVVSGNGCLGLGIYFLALCEENKTEASFPKLFSNGLTC